MATCNALYVRKRDADDATRKAILRLYPNARIEELPDFVVVRLSGYVIEPPEQKLAQLSDELSTDVIWVTLQTQSGGFAFHHWHDGQTVRVLVYVDMQKGSWARVEGQAESWEHGCFWNEKSLARHLAHAKTESEQAGLRNRWRQGLLIHGETLPFANADATIKAIMHHYALFDPNPPEFVGAIRSSREKLLRALVWAAVLCSIGLLLWRGFK